jgi:hypothetical protein
LPSEYVGDYTFREFRSQGFHYTGFSGRGRGKNYGIEDSVWQAKRFKKRIVATILYVFYFSWFLCYASIVPGKQTNPKRKEASIVKKLEKLFEEFYESFSHREG